MCYNKHTEREVINMDLDKVIDMVTTECHFEGRCCECDFEPTCRLCDAALPQVLRNLKENLEFSSKSEPTVPKCPNCGSTAQVKQDGYFTTQYGSQYKQYICGCSCKFIVNN